MKARDRRLLQSVKLDEPFGFQPHPFDRFVVSRLLRGGLVWADCAGWLRITDTGRQALKETDHE